ncbi:MAG TPA: hypothetical protein VIP77_15515 [Jiangellaceae bacterium]
MSAKIEAPAVEAELRAAASKLRSDKDCPADECTAELLDHIALDMEVAGAEERDFPDHVAQYQRMVAQLQGFESRGVQVVQWVDRMDWTAALALARFVNGSTPQEVSLHG